MIIPKYKVAHPKYRNESCNGNEQIEHFAARLGRSYRLCVCFMSMVNNSGLRRAARFLSRGLAGINVSVRGFNLVSESF